MTNEKTKRALVIHPVISFYAGGEYLCLNVCQAMQEMGYKVSLACDEFRPAEVERLYGLGNVMQKCEFVPVPAFKPRFKRFTALQRLLYGRRVCSMFWNTNADIVFSTQSSPFVIPQRIFHFIYDAADMFGYPVGSAPPDSPIDLGGLKGLYYKALRLYIRIFWKKQSHAQDWFFAVGSSVLTDLRMRGYSNSSLVFPPCRINFTPRFPKRKQVVQAVRLLPEKRLELYYTIAQMLPDCQFYLIGRDSAMLRRMFPGYGETVLSKLPENVTYLNNVVREKPELFQESKIYLYTGTERGIGLAVVEAISAGCIPFSPPNVGAADIIQNSGVGEIYKTAEEAAAKIAIRLDEQFTIQQVLDISRKANKFSPEVFREWVKKVTQSPNTVGLSASTID